MAATQSAEDIFLDLMRTELADPSLSIEDALQKPLAGLLLQTLQKGLAPAQPENLTELETSVPRETTAQLDGSAALVRVALQDTFAMADLQFSESERTALLAASDLVMIEGIRRLRLSDVKRAEILKAARSTDLYASLLREALVVDTASTVPSDPIQLTSIWLRRFLAGEFHDLRNAPPGELRAARDARERLRCVDNLASNVPPLADLDRRVGFAELLEPLRVLIGSQGGWNGIPPGDRFVGRDEELKRLRAFVDELTSHGVGETLGRAFSRLKRVATQSERPWIMMVEARGGLGKSTLLAKFVIEHALGQSRPFPFAYLDFDRAGLDPERPSQLLIEIARQVGFQFAPAQPDLNVLIDSIRAELARTSANPNVKMNSGIQDPYARFAEILREHATFGTRAFLVVFDTLELVQWNPIAMKGLARLVNEFRDKGMDELCVVASGRADVPELYRNALPRVKLQRIKLKPLLVGEARQMADALGYAAIGDEWQGSWSAAIAGPALEEARREPLAVRVAVDFIARANAWERPILADEVAKTGFGAHGDFVARLYLKRIVNHVRDPRAQKLAWPGLVVRRVTLAIARDFLAPLCDLSPEDVDAAFKALGNEVWMVTKEKDALKHRPDLRERTLPLMRMKEPEKFNSIARKAVAYFESRREISAEDAAEWIYHRLLIGEDPETISRDVKEDILPLLAKAEGDFPRESPAASYVASRTARTRLSPRRIHALQTADALYHLSVTSSGTFTLDDSVIDPVALELSDRLKDETVILSTPLNLWARALFIKTGAWQRLLSDPESFSRDLTGQALRAHLFWAARIAPSISGQYQADLLEYCERYVTTDSRTQAPTGYRTTVQVMALARITESERFSALDRRVAEMLADMKPNSTPSVQAALRTTIVLGKLSRGPALALWLASRRHGSGDRVRNPTISAAEIKALARLVPDATHVLGSSLREERSLPARFSDQGITSTMDRELEETLSDLRDGMGSERAVRLARMFALRDEDWIVPFGYAAARGLKGKLSAALSHRLASYAYLRPDQAVAEKPEFSDVLSAMRFADEAADLASYARVILAECDPSAPSTAELRFLVNCRDAWSRSIVSVIGTNETTNAPDQGRLRSEEAPEPGTIIHRKDIQKDRWGGKPERDGRVVHLVLESVEKDVFYFSVIVESTDNSPLEPPVIFHLHDSYPRNVVTIRRIVKERQAVLSEWQSFGVFAIGVQVKDASNKWTSLEIDLADLAGLPERFLKR